jgi:hypothetical protein
MNGGRPERRQAAMANDWRARLIRKARRRHGAIRPCAGRRSLRDCFTRLPDGELALWFNTPDGNTHIEIETLDQQRGRARQGLAWLGAAWQGKARDLYRRRYGMRSDGASGNTHLIPAAPDSTSLPGPPLCP